MKRLLLCAASHVLYILSIAPLAAAQDDALAKFGDTIQVLGQMARTDQDFTDGLALDLFSPTNRTLVVTNNTKPLEGHFVTGSSGEGFVNLSNYSWIIRFNETAKDLIAKIELPFDPVALKKQGIDASNTYVGTLAADKRSWIVSETQRNVHNTENKTRIIKMTSLDGEYMLLGRKSEDTTNIFVQYGQGATRTVNVTGGNGIQEAEFVDGMRLHVQSNMAFRLNADIPFGVDQAAVPQNAKVLNSFAWTINTTIPAQNRMAVDITFPINKDIVKSKFAGMVDAKLAVAHRGLHSNGTSRFELLEKQNLDPCKGHIQVKGLSAVDGQYVILVMNSKAASGSKPEAEQSSRTQKLIPEAAVTSASLSEASSAANGTTKETPPVKAAANSRPYPPGAAAVASFVALEVFLH